MLFPLLTLMLKSSLDEDELQKSYFLFCHWQESKGYFNPLFNIISDDNIDVRTVVNTI